MNPTGTFGLERPVIFPGTTHPATRTWRSVFEEGANLARLATAQTTFPGVFFKFKGD
jgi:hypothetical protein